MTEISLPEWVRTQMARLDQEIEKSLSLENGELRALSIDGSLCAWAVVSDIFQNTATPDYVLAVTVTLFEGKVKRQTRPLAKERAISKFDIGLWLCENEVALAWWVTEALGAIWTSINTAVKDMKSRARRATQFIFDDPTPGSEPRYTPDLNGGMSDSWSPQASIGQQADFGRRRQMYNGGSYGGSYGNSRQAARDVYEPEYYQVPVLSSARERGVANIRAAAMQAAMNQQISAQMDQMGRELGMNVFGLAGTRAGTPILTPLQSAPGPKIVVAAIGSSRRRIILEDE